MYTIHTTWLPTKSQTWQHTLLGTGLLDSLGFFRQRFRLHCAGIYFVNISYVFCYILYSNLEKVATLTLRQSKKG